jgi:hypothetical protein
MTRLSIIVPTRAIDPAILARARANAVRAGADELILVEPDDLRVGPIPTLAPGWRHIRAPRGRGSQCSRGAEAAHGELLMVLHDDTDLPEDAGQVITEAFADPDVGMTCFRLRFDRRHWLLGLYSAWSRIESPLTTFGDQAMVIRRSIYDTVGGMPDWPLFEDVDLARRVRRASRIRKLAASVTTSAVRFTEKGLLRQQLSNGVLLARFLLGGSPRRLAEIYERQGAATREPPRPSLHSTEARP